VERDANPIFCVAGVKIDNIGNSNMTKKGLAMTSRMHGALMVVALGVGGAMAAQAAEGDLIVRGRATLLDFHNGQNGMPALVEADSRWIPEVDFSYFFSDHLAAELVLTYPQKVNINVNGAAAGSVRALPPTLLAQYHFEGTGAFQPYVGAGVNLTLFSKRDLLGGTAHVDKSSVGLTGQIGADYALSGQWSLNVDLKYIAMNTGVHVSGSKLGTLDLNPWAASIGLGYRF
jgi:outer membrane protein